ncbi:Dual specificity protein phosphatase 3 [Orchesella cincta]|uniref:protein-serine/threonine phosphatase n=1 Tax=Orchesella cincta TaxID=48709 RepID=A0A1D2NM66_ORCCI|nr:Dual specificity protein phosphatase 3 [Orchesella cincta]
MSCRVFATSKEELKAIVRERWCPPRNSYDEVYPGILIGDSTAALSVRTLVREGVTHVVNAAMACSYCQAQDYCGTCVLTRPSFYAHSTIKFKGVEAIDDRRCQLYKHFDDVASFIDEALANRGKVLVHCHQGISRSATLVLAYLMIHKGMSAKDAVQIVRRKREIFPNEGFFQQLSDLELRLRSAHRIYA